jgi:hypothetical protein
MKLKVLAAAAALSLAAVAGATRAGVVTFDDAAGNAIVDKCVSSFSDQGLTFTGSYCMGVWALNPNGNGTNSLIYDPYVGGGGGPLTITKTGGGAFSLGDVDLSVSWYDSNPTETITINGSPLTISQTYATYDLGLTDVTSVTISGVASQGGYWLADNLNFSAGVPEPASWATMLIGLFGLGAVMRASRRTAVVPI